MSMHRRIPILAVLILLIGLSPLAGAEQVILRNGDRIGGRVYFEEKMVGVTPEYAENILLERSAVEKVLFEGDGRPRRLEELGDAELERLVREAPGREEYPEAGAIYLLEQQDVEVLDEHNWRTTSRQLIRILQERRKDLADVTVSFYRDFQTVEVLLARSFKPDGTIHYLTPDGTKTTAIYARYPLYDRKDMVQFAVPEVKEGDIIELVTRVTTRRIDLLHLPDVSAFMRGVEPSLRTECRLQLAGTHAGRERFPFRWKLFNFRDGDTPEARLTRSSAGLDFQLSYDRPQAGMIHEPNRPPFRDLVPRLNASLTTEYPQMVREALHRLKKGGDGGEAVRNLVRELCAGAVTDFDKADRLYRMVAYRIKPVGVPLYITQLEPHPPEKILSEKYGGSLDRLVLLYALFEAAGLPAGFLFVRHRDAGRWDREVPSIFDFQQLILRVRCDGQWVYLMEPSEFRPLDLISQECQGAEALLLTPEGGEFLRLPGEEHYPGGSFVRLQIRLDAGGGLQIGQREEYAGLDAVGLRSNFKRMKPLERERMIRYAVERELKNTQLESFSLSDLDALNDTVSVNFSYRAEGFADAPGEGRYLVLRLPFVSLPTEAVGKETRVYDLYQPFRDRGERDYTLELPEGYRVYHLPPDRREGHPLFQYERSFEQSDDGRRLRFRQRLSIGGGTVAVADYPQFRDLLNSVAGIEREWIVLERQP